MLPWCSCCCQCVVTQPKPGLEHHVSSAWTSVWTSVPFRSLIAHIFLPFLVMYMGGLAHIYTHPYRDTHHYREDSRVNTCFFWGLCCKSMYKDGLGCLMDVTVPILHWSFGVTVRFLHSDLGVTVPFLHWSMVVTVLQEQNLLMMFCTEKSVTVP